MTKAKLLLAPSVFRDIDQQSAYYRSESGPELADRWELAVTAALEEIRSLPEKSAPLLLQLAALRTARSAHIRHFPKHLVIYTYQAEAHTVKVHKIIHGMRHLEKILRRR